MLLISVPWLNPLRMWKVKLGCYRERAEESEQFFQYAFSTEEWSDIFARSGFNLIEWVPIGAAIGLRKETSGLLHSLLRIPPLYLIFRAVLDGMPIAFARFSAHMILTVAMKPSGATSVT